MADDTNAPATGAPDNDDSDAQQMLADAVDDTSNRSGNGNPPDLGDAGKRALAEERKARRDAESRLKELEPLAQKAKELEDAQKTEQERLNEALQAAQVEGATSKSELLRLDVALEKAPEGMPVAKIRTLAKRLTGSNREELVADAEELFAEFAPKEDERRPANQRPKENLRAVHLASDGEMPKTDMNERMRAMARNA